MNDIISFDVRPYAIMLTDLLRKYKQNDIQVLDDVHEFPKITRHPQRYPIPDGFEQHVLELVHSIANEAICSRFVYTQAPDQHQHIAKLFNSSREEVFDWFFSNQYIDGILLDLTISVTSMIKAGYAHRAMATMTNGFNFVVFIGEDYRIVKYEEERARELTQGGWAKQISGLANYLATTFSQPIENLPPLTSILTVSQIIHIGLSARFPNIALDNRMYLNTLLNSVGQTVDSIASMITPLLFSTGIMGEVGDVVFNGAVYTFKMDSRGMAIIEPSSATNAIDKRFYELSDIVNSGGYLPRNDREFYEAELRRR